MGKLETWTSGVLLCTVSVGHPPHPRKSHKEGKCLHSNRVEPCRRQDFEILIHTEDTVDCYCWLLEKSVKHHTSPLVILLCSVACRAPGGHWAAVSSFIIQWKINQNSQIAACYHYLKLITKETFLCLQLGQTQALSSSNSHIHQWAFTVSGDTSKLTNDCKVHPFNAFSIRFQYFELNWIASQKIWDLYCYSIVFFK